ncbi:MAG: DUF4190 domain-containing protein [Actinobacteria bacterium]|jgi:hypothetical protein|nr:DUF4190 domain-containing protein [Actinomycetota bacterium]
MSNQQDPSFQPQGDFAEAAPLAPEVPAAPAYPAPAAPAYPATATYPAAPGYVAAPAPATTNTMAIVAMISSIVGWFAFGSLCVVGVILGHISLKQIKQTGEGGRGMALTGLIMGYIGIAGWIIGLILFFIFLGIAGVSLAAAGANA